MMDAAIPPYKDTHSLSHSFRVKGNISLIESESKKGVFIEVDNTRTHACAYFYKDDTISYNEFKRLVV